MDKVSVIISTYNRGNALRKAIISCLEQTHPVHEILVCDDGSSDNSREIVHALDNPRVAWIEGSHAGRPAVPRNRGLRKASGDWIAFLDDDDTWAAAKIEKQLSVLKISGCQASSSNAFRVIENENSGPLLLGIDMDEIDFRSLLEVNNVICSSAVVHRSVFEKAVGFPEQPGLKALEDYALWLRVSTFTPFCFVKECLVFYNDQPNTSIRSTSAKVLQQKRSVYTNYLEWAASVDFSQKREMTGLVRQFRRQVYFAHLRQTAKSIFR